MKTYLSIFLLMLAGFSHAQITTFPNTVKASNVLDISNVLYWGADPTGVADSTVAFQSTINSLTAGGTVRIPEGVFSLTAPIWLTNNLTIAGSSGTVLKKTAAYCHVFVNRGAATGVTNYNITLRNLIINANNNGVTAGGVTGQRGQLNFFYVNNLEIDNVSITNSDVNLFGFHMGTVTHARIKNYSYHGQKDTMDIGAESSDIVWDGGVSDGYDDVFIAYGSGYSSVTHRVGDVNNILIKNIVIKGSDASHGGHFSRLAFMPASWTNWANGNSYKIGNVAVNAGNIYIVESGTTNTGTVAPIHTSGNATGADSITWRWLQAGAFYNANVRNIVFENITMETAKSFQIILEDNEFVQHIYPGTENRSIVDGIRVTGLSCSFTNGGTSSLFNLSANSGTWAVESLRYNPDLPSTSLLHIYPGARVDSFLLRDLRMTIPVPSNTYPTIICSGAALNSLIMDNCTISGRTQLDNTEADWCQNESNSIATIVINGGVYTRFPNLCFSSGTAATQSISVTSARFDAPARIYNSRVAGSQITARFAACYLDGASTNKLFQAAASSSFKLSTVGCTINGTTNLLNSVVEPILLDTSAGDSSATVTSNSLLRTTGGWRDGGEFQVDGISRLMGLTGVKTNAPQDALHVNGAIRVGTDAFSGQGRLYNSSTLGFTLVGTTGSSYDFTVANPAGNLVWVVPAGSQNFCTTAGTIGIGTLAPSSSLDVPGEARIGTLIATNATFTNLNVTTLNAANLNISNAPANWLVSNAVGHSSVIISAGSLSTVTGNARVTFRSHLGGSAQEFPGDIMVSPETTGGGDSIMRFGTSLAGTLNYGVAINRNGFLGVGTTNALDAFHVVGGVVQTNGGIWQHFSIGAPAAPAANTQGAVLWNDGTNWCSVFRNGAGTLSTNKLSMTSWP